MSVYVGECECLEVEHHYGRISKHVDMALTCAARGELLAWLNELLAPYQITKVEQCGTGATYCQVSLPRAQSGKSKN